MVNVTGNLIHAFPIEFMIRKPVGNFIFNVMPKLEKTSGISTVGPSVPAETCALQVTTGGLLKSLQPEALYGENTSGVVILYKACVMRCDDWL